MDGTEFTRLSLKYKRPEQYLKEVFITLSDPDEKVLLWQSKLSKNLCNFEQKLHFVSEDNKIWVKRYTHRKD